MNDSTICTIGADRLEAVALVVLLAGSGFLQNMGSLTDRFDLDLCVVVDDECNKSP